MLQALAPTKESTLKGSASLKSPVNSTKDTSIKGTIVPLKKDFDIYRLVTDCV